MNTRRQLALLFMLVVTLASPFFGANPPPDAFGGTEKSLARTERRGAPSTYGTLANVQRRLERRDADVAFTAREQVLRIALVSDTQIQTPSHKQCRGRTGFRLDHRRSTGTACRPFASEALAKSSLKVILAGIAAETPRPDFGLYLGDAANNGCSDELDPLLELLAQSDFPIFIVPGNHDLLRAGNLASAGGRRRGCGETSKNARGGTFKNTLSKGEVSARILDHNRRSFSALKGEPSLSASGWVEGPDSVKPCGLGRASMTGPGCWGGQGFIVERGGRAFVIQLVDSNDYFSRVGAKNIFRGVRGFVSQEQSAFFGKQFDEARESLVSRPVLVAASHYDLMSLTPTAASECRRRGRKSAWIGNHSGISAESAHDWPSATFWLSGHTHVDTPVRCAPRTITEKISGARRGVAAFCEINVGSTTDWIPHAALVELGPCPGIDFGPQTSCIGVGKVTMMGAISEARAIASWGAIRGLTGLSLEAGGCSAPKLASQTSAVPDELSRARAALGDSARLACQLGLTLDYRDADERDAAAIYRNIHLVLSRAPSREEGDVWASALSYLAAATEGPHQPNCSRCLEAQTDDGGWMEISSQKDPTEGAVRTCEVSYLGRTNAH